ncbi:hypothetical protein GNI_112080 [Gregarina niphandrodes]|uniref:Uncharacterized protein n=2 Tax=Gregarina niphandrodes TaxID=110365 RepID=A0A023B3N5_GRENI|nr:hypothetical protein GNI_112080 [Gregarina niphandrodes]EZG55482.1 hypothetical protein GNI_112080 [Gregarina niphandrodes]|eukprot:XP_011131539.1 hypothetical protein GNI_112080 [Gregarina niphandrodes]
MDINVDVGVSTWREDLDARGPNLNPRGSNPGEVEVSKRARATETELRNREGTTRSECRSRRRRRYDKLRDVLIKYLPPEETARHSRAAI